MPVLNRVTAYLFVLCSVNCGSSGLPPSDPMTPQNYVVSGTLFETARGVSRPLAGRQLHLYISGTCGTMLSPCRPELGRQPVITDQNGWYTAQVPDSWPLSAATWVFVTANVADVIQPCVASASVDRDTTIDVFVLPTTSTPTPSAASNPLVSGVVYEETAGTRTPLSGVVVWLEVGFESYLIAHTRTDEAGRFSLCRVNAPSALVHAPVVLRTFLAGYAAAPQSISGTGDISLEIALKR